MFELVFNYAYRIAAYNFLISKLELHRGDDNYKAAQGGVIGAGFCR